MIKGLVIERLKELNRNIIKELIEVYISGYSDMDKYHYTRSRDIKRYIKWLFKRDKNGFFVAKDGEKIIGFVACDANWNGIGAIHEIVVRKEYQGRGIGKKLMEKCLAYLSKYVDKIELYVGSENERAINFYKKFGFKIVHDFGYWTKMIKILKSNSKFYK